jgi:hypothetical protein
MKFIQGLTGGEINLKTKSWRERRRGTASVVNLVIVS